MREIAARREQIEARADAVTRAIITSSPWVTNVDRISGLSWMERRELFRWVFDDLEGPEGEDWLGVLESGVLTTMGALGRDFSNDPATIAAILSFVGRHPNMSIVD